MLKPLHFLYIAGPMTGIPEYNAPAFRAAADELRSRGYGVISPVELDEADGVNLEAEAAGATTLLSDPGWDWARALARDISVIIREADFVVALPGWEGSRGAFLETATAYALGRPVVEYPDLTPIPFEAHPSRMPGIRAPYVTEEK